MIWLGIYVGFSLGVAVLVAYLAWVDEIDGPRILVVSAAALLLWPALFLMGARDVYRGRGRA